MKKIITAALASATLLSTASFADIYLGVDAISGDSMSYTMKANTGGSATWDATETGYRIKLGAGELDDWTWQLYYSAIESNKYYWSSKSLTEFGYDLRPGWEIGNNFYFTLPFGINYGITETDSTVDSSSWARVGFKVGASISYVVADQIEFLAGYDYKGVVWQDIVVGSTTFSTTGSGSGMYFGVNLWFGNANQKAIGAVK
ncbi:hypothetical protein KKG72_06580 [bacterium]|nr:hypothetical protein [bacterium]MBU1994863.1 hypothetical protein [bacterium]